MKPNQIRKLEGALSLISTPFKRFENFKEHNLASKGQVGVSFKYEGHEYKIFYNGFEISAKNSTWGSTRGVGQVSQLNGQLMQIYNQIINHVAPSRDNPQSKRKFP